MWRKTFSWGMAVPNFSTFWLKASGVAEVCAAFSPCPHTKREEQNAIPSAMFTFHDISFRFDKYKDSNKISHQ